MSRNAGSDKTITRAELAEEARRIKKLRKQGWTYTGPCGGIKSWLRGWRQVSPLQGERNDRNK